jgi:Cu-Zn family superoxide dismutase
MRIPFLLTCAAALTLATALFTSGFAQTAPATAPASAPIVTRAVAVLVPTKGNTLAGTIWFDKTATGVHVHGAVTGLAPKSVHGFHIHEFGDQSSDDGMAAGGHFNPEGHVHGGPDSPMHHAGDMGNLTADDAGKATVDLTIMGVSISDGKEPILGHGVVLHAGEDNLQPNANPGARMAVGVIGIAKP